MHAPCLKDLSTAEEKIPETEVVLSLLFEVEYMLTQAENDPSLELLPQDKAVLYLRKANILCLLNKITEAKYYAELAVSLAPSAASFYRLGVTCYLLSEFEASSKAFMDAYDYDVASSKIQHALDVLALRCRSIKDKGAFIN